MSFKKEELEDLTVTNNILTCSKQITKVSLCQIRWGVAEKIISSIPDEENKFFTPIEALNKANELLRSYGIIFELGCELNCVCDKCKEVKCSWCDSKFLYPCDKSEKCNCWICTHEKNYSIKYDGRCKSCFWGGCYEEETCFKCNKNYLPAHCKHFYTQNDDVVCDCWICRNNISDYSGECEECYEKN